MADFTKLKVWQKAHELTIRVYALTKKLPKEEEFNLKSQARRAAVSCESNIAEGETRYTNPDKITFFIDSRSSAAEVQSQLMDIRDIYSDLLQESSALISEYEHLAKQINNLITFRRNSAQKNLRSNPKTQKPNLISQKPNNLIT